MIGETLGNYRIMEQMGSGGMGLVFAAVDSRLGRTVALKLIDPARAHDLDKRRRRFRREARLTSRLNHPGIVTIHELSTDKDVDFIVMEKVEGRSLEEVLSDGPLPWRQALDFAIQAAEAMAAAHALQIVHRDLKPSNIMIGPGGRLKILDFGVAALMRGDAETTSIDTTDLQARTVEELTEDIAGGSSPGTRRYMSPEQLLGEPLDGRTDLYSLGLVLYEMLFGEIPFASAGPNAPLQRVLDAVDMPTDGGGLGIPAPLVSAVMSALARKVEDRSEDMEAWLGSLRAVDQPSSEPASVGGSLGQRAWLLGIPALLMVGLIHERAQSPAETPADSARESQAATLPSTSWDYVQQGDQLLARFDRDGYLDQAIEAYEKAIQLAPDNASAFSGLSRAYWRRYRLDRQATWLDLAWDQGLRAEELNPQLIHSQVSLAMIEIDRGQLEPARRRLSESAELNPLDPFVPWAFSEIAKAEGKRDERQRALRKAVELDPSHWVMLADLAALYQADGKYDDAEQLFDQAIRIARDNVNLRYSRAAIYHFQGRFEAAAAELQESIAIRPTPLAYSNLGTLYFFEGYYRKSAEAYEQAVRLSGTNELIWANYGDALRRLPDRAEEAESAFRTAIRLAEERAARSEREVSVHSRLALYLAKVGRCERSLQILEGELLTNANFGDELSVNDRYREALTFELCGRRADALSTLRSALQRGYSRSEVEKDPELVSLRADSRYQLMLTELSSSSDS